MLSPPTEAPVITLGASPRVISAVSTDATDVSASPPRIAARRKTMRMDDGISRLLHRQSMFQATIDAGTLRDMADPDDVMADFDAALDAMSVASRDEPEDDYMNEHGQSSR